MSDIKFKFDPNAETVYSSEYYYDLFDGGYISPGRLLSDPDQIAAVNSAVDTIEQFFRQAEAVGLLEES